MPFPQPIAGGTHDAWYNYGIKNVTSGDGFPTSVMYYIVL